MAKTRVWDKKRLMMFDLSKIDVKNGAVLYEDNGETVKRSYSDVTIIEFLNIQDKDSLDIYYGDIIIIRGKSVKYLNSFTTEDPTDELRIVAENSQEFYNAVSIADEIELIGDAFNNPMLARN